MSVADARTGTDVMAQFIPACPLAAKLGIVAEELSGDEIRLRMPFDPTNTTLGDMVHGGAIATLADMTVMALAVTQIHSGTHDVHYSPVALANAVPFLCAHCEGRSAHAIPTAPTAGSHLGLHSGPVTSDNAELPTPRRWAGVKRLRRSRSQWSSVAWEGPRLYVATQGSPHAPASRMRGPAHSPPPRPDAAPPAQTPTGAAGVLHSEYVVSDGHGDYTTKMTQTGVVDELTLSQTVIRSDDGFTQIYVFFSASVVPDKSVTAKDTVTVEATRTGPTLTLDRIGEGQPPPTWK
jgi:uncharacterized protein (TIGR00369 family)